ncbi:MAG: hypothetical protein R3C01_10965 [Planctomycetaceae bacterium]
MPTPNTQKKRTSIVVFVDRDGSADAYLREENPEAARVIYRPLPLFRVNGPSPTSTRLSWLQTFLSIFVGLFT